jgi:hypothetical protein
LARQQSILKKANTDAKRLAAADESRARGDIRVAGRIYVSLVMKRPATPASETAKQRLADLQTEAKEKLAELDRRLPGSGGHAASDGRYAGSISSRHDPNADATQLAKSKSHGARAAGAKKGVDKPDAAEDDADDEPAEQTASASAADSSGVLAVFQDYDRLIAKYGELPAVGPEIKAHVSKLRHQPEYAVILNEPAATKLWKLGEEYERDNHVCCAYWTYKKAAEFLPAPSAVLASQRFADLAKDPQVVASAETCRELKWCHQAYLRAERLKEANPERAKELYAEIVRRAPADSEVHRAAKQQVQ